MMFKLFVSLFFAFILALMVSCGSSSNDKVSSSQNESGEMNEVQESNAEVASPAETNEASITEKEFVFESITESENHPYPATKISFVYNGKTIELSTFAGDAQKIEKESYAEMGIPDASIAACSSWWAGAGEYFYLIFESEKLVVYKGAADEMQEDTGYHWERFKEI